MVALRPVFVMHLCSRASRGCGPLEAPLGLEDQPPGSPLPGLVGQCWPTVGGGGSIPLQTGHSAGLLEGPRDTVACPRKPESQEGAKQKPKRSDVALKASLGHFYHGSQSKGPVPAQGRTDETWHAYQEVGSSESGCLKAPRQW